MVTLDGSAFLVIDEQTVGAQSDAVGRRVWCTPTPLRWGSGHSLPSASSSQASSVSAFSAVSARSSTSSAVTAS